LQNPNKKGEGRFSSVSPSAARVDVSKKILYGDKLYKRAL